MRKQYENMQIICVVITMLKELCSGLRVHIQIQKMLLQHVMSCDQHSFLLRHWSKSMTILKKCPIFQYFVFFSMRNDLCDIIYIYLQILAKGLQVLLRELSKWLCFWDRGKFDPKRKLVTVFQSMLFHFLMWSQNVTSYLLS